MSTLTLPMELNCSFMFLRHFTQTTHLNMKQNSLNKKKTCLNAVKYEILTENYCLQGELSASKQPNSMCWNYHVIGFPLLTSRSIMIWSMDFKLTKCRLQVATDCKGFLSK